MIMTPRASSSAIRFGSSIGRKVLNLGYSSLTPALTSSLGDLKFPLTSRPVKITWLMFPALSSSRNWL